MLDKLFHQDFITDILKEPNILNCYKEKYFIKITYKAFN